MKDVSMWMKVASAVIILLLGFSGTMMTMLYTHQVKATERLETKLDAAIEKLDDRLDAVEVAVGKSNTNIGNLVTLLEYAREDIQELRSP